MRQFVIAALAGVACGFALPATAADAQAGAKVFRTQCSACHTVEEGKHRVGPSLFGVFGRKNGQAEGFKYSAANKKADLTWDEATLDKYLTNPRALIPGTTMAFVGIRNATQRENVIEYLKTVK